MARRAKLVGLVQARNPEKCAVVDRKSRKINTVHACGTRSATQRKAGQTRNAQIADVVGKGFARAWGGGITEDQVL